MSQFPDPQSLGSSTSSNSGSSDSDHSLSPPSLEAGLAALEQNDYELAIAQLTEVYKTTARQTTRLKAQMGLVKAYESSGQLQEAMRRCQTLLNSPSEPARQWAEKAMGVLEQRYGAQADPTGFTPLDPTGFTPLSSTESSTDAGSSSPHPPATDTLAAASQSPASPDASSPPTQDVPQPVASFEDDSETTVGQTADGNTDAGTDASTDAGADESADVTNPFAFPFDTETEGEPIGGTSDAVSNRGVVPPKSPETGEPRGTSTVEQRTAHGFTAHGSTQPSHSNDADLAASLNTLRPRSRSSQSSTKRKAPTPSTPLASLQANAPSERARQWKPLTASNQLEFWLSSGWAIAALVALLTLLIRIALATARPVWRQISRVTTPPRWPWLENHPVWVVVLGLLVLLVVSPWVLRWMLGQFYGVKPLPDRELERRSPETHRVLQRVCKQQRLPAPPIGLLPSQAPVVFSYGHLPRTTRIVLSQGLLTQLSDDEIAALVAAELGLMKAWARVPLTLVTLVIQVPFLVYWLVAQWGDRHRNALLRGLAAAIASITYGFYWLLRWPGLWLARTRQRQGDRQSTSITGNPNGLMRALVKMTTGIAQETERQRYTAYSLEGFDLLIPVGHRQALTLGSVYSNYSKPSLPQTAESASADADDAREMATLNVSASLWAWDAQNSHRRLLTFNNSHPPLGDRLATLSTYARQWRLRPDITISAPRTAVRKTKAHPFWLQMAPYVGAPIGLGLAIALWLVGIVAEVANLDSLEWLLGDRSLLWGCLAIGFSFGTLMRINAFFPDIKSNETLSETDLPELLCDPKALPIDSVPVQFRGRLLGRTGTSNGLNQDLMLRTSQGSIPLHCVSQIGPLGNLILGKTHPPDLVGQSVVVTGWFRRGATPWIDVETLRPETGPPLRSGHPIWSTLLAVIATLWGTFIIYQGSL